jgi:hypothetical protein
MQNDPSEQSCTFICDTHVVAENAIRSLMEGGIEANKISLIGKGYHSEEQPTGFYTTRDKIIAWGGNGAFWGSLWGILMAPAVFLLPPLGVVALAGPIVSVLVSALEGAVVVGGLSAIGAAMSRIGVDKNDIIHYESALKVNKYLLIVHGTATEISKAQSIYAASNESEMNAAN